MKSPESYIELAKAVHEGQKDKRGRDYINHPIEVSQAVKHLGPSYEAVAILHDVVEDADPKIWDHDELTKTIEGFGVEIADAVKAITKSPDEKYFDYIVRVKGNEIAAQVKLDDLKINYATISDIPDPETVKSLGKRYEKAISILEEEDFATAVLSEMVRF